MEPTINEIQTYFGRCRCCLSYGYLKNMWEEHYWEGQKEVYVEMLIQCFALSWERSEEYMEHDQICETCIKRLRDAHMFKKVVLESQEELLGHIESVPSQVAIEETVTESEVKLEATIKDEEDYTARWNETCGGESPAEHMYIDDPYDPEYVDPDDPDDPNEGQYEEIEYLEDEDNKEALDAQMASKKGRRTKTPSLIDPNRKWPRKLPKSERYKTYKQYTEEDLRKALEAVRNEEMTALEAANKYNIPRKTICAKLKSDPNDDQNGTTAQDIHKTTIKHKMRKGPTVFRDNRLKLKKIPEKVLTTEKHLQNEVIDEKDDVTTLLLNIKTEEGISDVPVDAEQVRTKYKAIVNAKFKNTTKESEKPDVNELDKHKNNIKHILESSNATLIKGFWGNGYSCCFCDIQKEQPAELKQHNLELHSNIADDAIKVKYVSDLVIRVDITALKCKLCDQNIDTLESLTDHLSKAHERNIHTDIKNHIIPFRFETNSLQCVKCMKEFKYFKLLSEHMSEHYRNYECSVCERSFINKQSMQTHSYRHKNGVFKCSHCPKVFDTRPKRSVHERVTHTLSNKTRKCNYCDERFSTKDLVQSHESKVHGAKIPVFNCQACNKSYNSQSSLMTHRKRFHLMLRPHKCSYCEMAFFSRIELRSHTVTHTKSRDFKCDICNKSFGTRCSLNQHVRGHLDDRRFKCDSCERAFVHRTAFKVHMRSKHGKIV